jgi:hypothetical protein
MPALPTRLPHAKYSVPQITRCFSALGISTPEHFFSKICDCVICKGIIGKDLNAFAQFGERVICLTQVTTIGSVQAWWRNTRET